MSKQFIYVIHPTRPAMLSNGPTPEEIEVISRHFEYLDNLSENGVVLLAGRTLNNDSDAFGIVIFVANTEKEAHHLMENDPAVQKGVMHARLYPYQIATGYLNPER